jgi:hypothetical protein
MTLRRMADTLKANTAIHGREELACRKKKRYQKPPKLACGCASRVHCRCNQRQSEAGRNRTDRNSSSTKSAEYVKALSLAKSAVRTITNLLRQAEEENESTRGRRAALEAKLAHAAAAALVDAHGGMAMTPHEQSADRRRDALQLSSLPGTKTGDVPAVLAAMASLTAAAIPVRVIKTQKLVEFVEGTLLRHYNGDVQAGAAALLASLSAQLAAPAPSAAGGRSRRQQPPRQLVCARARGGIGGGIGGGEPTEGAGARSSGTNVTFLPSLT